jgi:hypothetical protein
MTSQEFIEQYKQLRMSAMTHETLTSYVEAMHNFATSNIPKLSDSCLRNIINNPPKPNSAMIFQTAYHEYKLRNNLLRSLEDYDDYNY